MAADDTTRDGDDEGTGVVAEVEHLAEVAQEGKSEATPVIAGTAVSIVVGAVVAVVLTVALLAYFLTR